MHSLRISALFFILSLMSCNQTHEDALFGFAPSAPTGEAKPKSVATDILFQSTDGGMNWEDVSAGLPLDTKAEGLFAADGKLLLTATEGIYRSSTTAKTANWEKEMTLKRPLSAISTAPTGTMAVSDNARLFQKLKGTDVWMPIFDEFKDKYVRTVFTAKDGSIFIGAEVRWGRGQNGIFKSNDQGKTWKHVMQDGWVIKMVESNGVLLCTNQGGILRSTDGGETWDKVLSEGGVGIDVAVINGGFAAITYNTESETRRIRTSKDNGSTWQAIDASLPPTKLVSTIVQVGEYFYCGHPDGIYRSADGGKTWHLALHGIGNKVFNLSVADGKMYALLREGGC